jgi:hypothetical protein
MSMYFTLDGRLMVEREIKGKKVVVQGPGVYLKMCQIMDELVDDDVEV